MASQPWARPHRTTITLDGVARGIEVARLTISRRANMRLVIAMLSQQRVRLESIGDRAPLEQLAIARDEREVNGQLGAWMEEELRESLRPVTPWLAPSGVEVVDGASFVEAYDNDALEAAFWAIYLSNELSEPLRKNSASPRDSDAGSPASATAARGDELGPTADPVDVPGSAPIAAVSAPPGPIPSGTTAPAPSPTSARSAA